MTMRDGLFVESFQDARARAVLTTFDINSPNCFNVRGAGRQVSKLVTLTAAGDPVAVNLFTISGMIFLYRIFGVFEDVTNVDDIEEANLDVWDGTVAVGITNTPGTVCDTAALSSTILKAGPAADALVFLNANQVRTHEAVKQSVLEPIALQQKSGVTTYLRMKYKNVDTNLNCQIRWYAEWRSLCGSPGVMAAV